ncbi:MAG: crosslink repair DNA glycosylase YcaQ family protein [Pseudomonadota bacterium]
MPDSASSIDEGRLRRIILAAHGLHRQAPFGRGRNGVLKALTQLGYAQIDTISVVERAHHHVLRSRIPGYRPALLDALVARREVFEYWFHAAAYLPMSDYRFARPRMDAVRRGEMHFQGPRDEKLMRRVHDRIRAEGPLSAADFDGERGPGGWWEWKPAKQALEILFFQGDLMVAERKGFQKRYDLAERVLPADIDTRAPSDQEYARHLIDHALRLFASTTVPEAGYLRRSARLREALRAELAARVEAGTVREIQLRDGSRRWLDTAAEAQTPRIMRTVHVLSPFDPLVIQRGRTAALFGFDYQIECYLPQSKRRFGYFCLPLLYGDRFLGQAFRALSLPLSSLSHICHRMATDCPVYATPVSFFQDSSDRLRSLKAKLQS